MYILKLRLYFILLTLYHVKQKCVYMSSILPHIVHHPPLNGVIMYEYCVTLCESQV